jgi:hypothetical protein
MKTAEMNLMDCRSDLGARPSVLKHLPDNAGRRHFAAPNADTVMAMRSPRATPGNIANATRKPR